MRQTEVAIVGGGAAGSAAAAILARAGIDAVLIDPHDVYPPDFRCEKIDRSQQEALERAGLSDVLDAATPGGAVQIVRRGRLVSSSHNAPSGIRYDDLVNRLRAEVPERSRLTATVTEIVLGDDRQTLSLSTGEAISARLVVMANGLNTRIRRALAIGQDEISHCHSISVGFDMAPVGGGTFGFSAMTCYAERIVDGVAYLTMFRIGEAMRANLFVYWEPQDERLAALRRTPAAALAQLFPNLTRLAGPFEVTSPVKVRPIDLTVSTGLDRPGLVLIGDAFATSCPAAGTGLNKVLTDAERLCREHIPRWLASDGIGAQKIAAFYSDPVKQACDSASTAKAFYLRALSTDTGMGWEARRWTRLVAQVGVGALKRAGQKLVAAAVLLVGII